MCPIFVLLNLNKLLLKFAFSKKNTSLINSLNNMMIQKSQFFINIRNYKKMLASLVKYYIN